MNSINLVGRLCADPETNQTPNSSVTSIRLAVSGSRKEGDQWVDDPTFVTCKAWAEKAEFLQKHFEKGKEIWIMGSLKEERWEKDGEKRSKVVVNISRCGFTSSNGGKKKDDDIFV